MSTENTPPDPAPADPNPANPPADPAPANPPADPPADPNPADPPSDPNPANPPADPPADPESAAGKILNQNPANPPADPKPGEPPADPAQQFTDEDFTKAMVATDEVKKAAGDDTLELSSELVKGMLPSLRKHGITPEQAKSLANDMAMQQIAMAKTRAAERQADIKAMNDEAMKLYPDKQSWDAIGTGITTFFKPGGAMYETIAKSELGSDPEFLALMKWVGERCKKDNLSTAPGSGGDKTASYEKALGLG